MGPRPISLKLSSAEITANARKLLRRLDADEQLRRRVMWQATKALVAISEMRSLAAPQVNAMRPGDRDKWSAQLETVKQFLERIADRGV